MYFMQAIECRMIAPPLLREDEYLDNKKRNGPDRLRSFYECRINAPMCGNIRCGHILPDILELADSE